MLYIRSELKCKPHENTACVFLTWTILPIEIDSNFKKMSKGWSGEFYSSLPKNQVQVGRDTATGTAL